MIGSASRSRCSACATLGVEVIADLCRFGVPSWLGGFQDPAFPVLFAEYARAFARRFPWVRCFTPVSDILQCAIGVGAARGVERMRAE